MGFVGPRSYETRPDVAAFGVFSRAVNSRRGSDEMRQNHALYRCRRQSADYNEEINKPWADFRCLG